MNWDTTVSITDQVSPAGDVQVVNHREERHSLSPTKEPLTTAYSNSTSWDVHRLHEMNEAKVHHLLDYLDKAAVNALEAAEAAQTAAQLSRERRGTPRLPRSRQHHVAEDADSWEEGAHPLGDTPDSHAALRSLRQRVESSAEEEGGVQSRESRDGVGCATTGWEESFQSQNISGSLQHPHSSSPAPSPSQPQHQKEKRCAPQQGTQKQTNEEDSLQRRNANALLPPPPVRPRAVHPTASSSSRTTSLTLHGTAARPHSRRHPDASATGRRSVASSGSANPNGSLQTVFLELKDKMDRLRYDNEVLRHDKDLLVQQIEHMKEGESAWRHHCAAESAAETKRLRKELQKLQKETRAEVETLQAENRGLVEQVEQLSRRLRLDASERVEEQKRVEAAHTTALSLLQCKYQSKERLARERWREEESKKIKAATLQALEPDIVLLLQRHKAEKARMEEEFTSVLKDKERSAAARERRLEEELVRAKETHQQHEAEAVARVRKEWEERLESEQKAWKLQHEEVVATVRRQWERECEAAVEAVETHHRERLAALDRDGASEVGRLQDEVLRYRQQYLQQLHEATREVEAAAEQKRLAWQDAFTAQQQQELSSYYQREAAQQIREAEFSIRRACEAERDASLQTVLDELQAQHKAELETLRQEKERCRGEVTALQRALETQKVELERYHDEARETSALQQRLEACEQRAALKQQAWALEAEELRAHFALQQSVAAAQWEKEGGQRLAAQETAHQRELNAMRAKEAQLHEAVAAAENAKRALAADQHHELQQLQARVMETVRMKEDVIRTLQEQLLELQREKEEREAWWEEQQEMLRQA